MLMQYVFILYEVRTTLWAENQSLIVRFVILIRLNWAIIEHEFIIFIIFIL